VKDNKVIVLSLGVVHYASSVKRFTMKFFLVIYSVERSSIIMYLTQLPLWNKYYHFFHTWGNESSEKLSTLSEVSLKVRNSGPIATQTTSCSYSFQFQATSCSICVFHLRVKHALENQYKNCWWYNLSTKYPLEIKIMEADVTYFKLCLVFDLWITKVCTIIMSFCYFHDLEWKSEACSIFTFYFSRP
jgi:hypothetical protein